MAAGYYYRWFVAVVILAMVIASSDAVIQCNDAVSQVLPCESFLLGSNGDSPPSDACCSAVKTLDGIAAASKEDRRAICECFKQTARSFLVNIFKAQQLPQLCHVNIPVGIDPNSPSSAMSTSLLALTPMSTAPAYEEQ